MKVYEGSQWVAAYASLSGALLVNNNLSDVASASSARTNLGLGTAAITASTDYATAAQGATADAALPRSGGAVTGNVTFGDNDKAIFGAGSDLQIYHSGSHSVIKDAGDGNLQLIANDFQLRNGADNANMMTGANGGAITLMHNGSSKLATNSTGVDITGTITSDGLTVSSSGAANSLTLTKTDGNATKLVAGNTEGTHTFEFNNGGMFLSDTTGLRLGLGSGGDISFYEDTGTTPKFFWDASAESLGIGTSSPQANLHVLDQLKVSSSSQATGSLVLGDGSSTAFNVGIARWNGATNAAGAGGVGYFAQGPSNAGGHFFYTGDAAAGSTSEAMRIDSSGNVGIGTSSPSQKLTIEGAAGYLATVQENSANKVRFQMYADATQVALVSGYNTTAKPMTFFTGGSEVMRIDSGNLLVGTTSGSDKVTVNGTVSATNFNTTSDATLKTNVETLSGSLDAVKSLRGVSFDWLESGSSEIGVIAQEVEAVLPDVVSTNDEGIKSVKYGNMVAVLIEAIKEQQLRIEALEAKLGE
jgi:hypothetical protein